MTTAAAPATAAELIATLSPLHDALIVGEAIAPENAAAYASALRALAELVADKRLVDVPAGHDAAALSGLLEVGQTTTVPFGLSQEVSGVVAERWRQIAAEGWTTEHDDRHVGGDLGVAALMYGLASQRGAGLDDAALVELLRAEGVPVGWPWGAEFWKPAGRLILVRRAAALFMAEYGRLLRERARLKLDVLHEPEASVPTWHLRLTTNDDPNNGYIAPVDDVLAEVRALLENAEEYKDAPLVLTPYLISQRELTALPEFQGF